MVMRYCDLNGELPHWTFSRFRNLKYLHLSGNNLRGRIPWSSFLNFEQMWLLDFSNNNFTGQIPQLFGNFSRTNSIFSLTFRVFRLSDNSLEGVIPTWIFEQPFLSQLNLSSNHFTGKLVDDFYNTSSLSLKNLGSLDFSSNSFSGPLPVFSSPLLRFLFASRNQFSGAIPDSICKIKSLEFLDLSDNNFTGWIPKCIGGFSQNLTLLNLRRNKLHGMIPPTFSKMISLRNINLNGNELEGPLPRSLMFCKSLEILDLGNNRFKDTFPGWLDLLPKLRVLILRDNMFHGPIGNPISKSPFPKLRIIDLSHNVFSGALPEKYFGNMTNLEWLDLSSNQLVGMIPSELLDITSLSFLNISHNHLVGPIPQGKQFNTFSSDSFSENSGLCGFPLTKNCGGSPLSPTPEQEGSSTRNEFNWKIVLMGFASGFVIRVSIGYMLLYSNGRLSWLCRRIEAELKQKIKVW